MSILLKTLVVVAFAGAGYAYYALIGCSSGACPITSSPLISTGYGGLIGAVLVFGVLPSKANKKTDED